MVLSPCPGEKEMLVFGCGVGEQPSWAELSDRALCGVPSRCSVVVLCLVPEFCSWEHSGFSLSAMLAALVY